MIVIVVEIPVYLGYRAKRMEAGRGDSLWSIWLSPSFSFHLASPLYWYPLGSSCKKSLFGPTWTKSLTGQWQSICCQTSLLAICPTIWKFFIPNKFLWQILSAYFYFTVANWPRNAWFRKKKSPKNIKVYPKKSSSQINQHIVSKTKTKKEVS